MSKQVTLEEASPSPPPLPKEPLPVASSSKLAEEGREDAADVPINSLGDDNEEDDEDTGSQDKGEDDEEEEEEWDPSEERLPGQSSKTAKGKGKATESESSEQPWQAVWAPEQNAWYFWNSVTGEVTWTNPLEPQPQAAAGAPPLPNEPAPPPLPQEAPPLPEARFGGIPDIDPDLAYLLPQGAAAAGGSGAGQTATFNARTGKFQQPDNTYSLDHLAEWNRAKRQAGHYFDVESWEQSVKEENAKRKREQETGVSESQKVTRKDMERFKKKKAEQKWKKQAWLRD